MKQVIFNVGGALSSYLEIDDKKIIIDLGKSNDFNPVIDFLKPLFNDRGELKNSDKNRYHIDQLILSHPHNDHISSIKDFDKTFYSALLTVPNDNSGNDNDEKINWSLVENPTDEYQKYLKIKMLPGRTPPLRSCSEYIGISWIKPKICENNNKLSKSNYTNNISLIVFIDFNGIKTILPGDIMKDGMRYLIANNNKLWNNLKEGIDILIAPHHGLRSSFSTELFETMKGEKTRCLNIISEKPNTTDNRNVDSRYSSNEYCKGENNLGNSENKVYQRKTSNGHIYIEYTSPNPKFEIINNNGDLLNKFI